MKFLKGTKLYSILTGACPVCQNENMYKYPNPYRMDKLFQMHERCSHCGTKYKIEPSFFFGAMYVSYAVGCGIAIITFLISFFLIELTALQSFFVILGLLFALYPWIVRVSRNIWINFFLHYDENAVKKHQHGKSPSQRKL